MQIDESRTDEFTPEDLARFEEGAREAEAGYDLAELFRTKPHQLHPENWQPDQ